ncbi:unnamed protein product [Parascedosporium putredinis]|uniref:Uncharacterized protein n=1 Tax=Parascedosporium putredinis TaxID=1442378 RepID=A0A9P1MFX4_9PEZI|nr:unnamed protein product [Parascedosporium putredinis]CAI8003286.1 unnamed protein product [Parascedosporium putredinis]
MEFVEPLNRRQDASDSDTLPKGWVIDDDGVARPWWYSRQGYIVKWSIFFGLLFLICSYMLIGYIHAKSRVKKGLPSLLPPLVPGYYPYQAPPPVPNVPRRPASRLRAPAGASKADPSQQFAAPPPNPFADPEAAHPGTGAQGEFAPPPGPRHPQLPLAAFRA